MTDRVDPAMNPMQPTPPRPALDSPAAQARPAKLWSRHDPMLALGELRHREINGCGKKPIPTLYFFPHRQIVSPQRPRALPR